MKSFSISELETLSTIKAHTFRVWEKRYSIVTPQRSTGNCRCYALSEIKHLLNVALLNSCGIKISHLARMDRHTIQKRISLLKDESDMQIMYVHDLIVAMYCMDAGKIDDILDDCTSLFGVHQTITKVIFPFLERVQLFTYKNQIKEVHFVVTSIRRKIIMAIETSKPLSYSNKNALLFLPQGEHYDLLLLYYSYILKAMGVRVWYMGTNVPTEDLISISKQKLPDLLLTHVRPNQIAKMKTDLEKITQSLPHSVLYVASLQEEEVQSSEVKNLKFFHYKEVPMQLNNVV